MESGGCERAEGFENALDIRLDGYWSHIENFAARSIVDFKLADKTTESKVTIESSPGFGAKRATVAVLG